MSVKRIPVDELVILPFEDMPARVVQTLASDLAARGIVTRIEAPVPLPGSAFVPPRGQYRAESLLALVSGYEAPHGLGITHRDLFAQDLNFVFGIASPSGTCVVSTARLLIGADDSLFRSRLLKEAVHELGHTLGLKHCAELRCAMHFSNSLADTDRKGDRYCDRCLALLDRKRH